MNRARTPCASVGAMGNVLDPNKQQQVVALGRLGWSLRRIEQATGVRRETVSGYRDRHRLPVGLTGLAQIHGLRGDTSIAERARFDNAYVELQPHARRQGRKLQR